MPPLVNRVARLLPHVCLLLAILAPVAVIALLALVPTEFFTKSLVFPESARAHLEFGAGKRLIAALILLLPVGCMSYALMNARSSLRRFNKGDYFSASAIRGIRGFGAGIFWSGILTLTMKPIAVFILTSIAGGTLSAGGPVLRIETDHVLMLVIGGILWQIASMMQRAAELAEENRQFV